MKPTYTNLAKYFNLTRQTVSNYHKSNSELYEALRDRFIKMNKKD